MYKLWYVCIFINHWDNGERSGTTVKFSCSENFLKILEETSLVNTYGFCEFFPNKFIYTSCSGRLLLKDNKANKVITTRGNFRPKLRSIFGLWPQWFAFLKNVFYQRRRKYAMNIGLLNSERPFIDFVYSQRCL